MAKEKKLLKITLIGDTQVGKTAIANRAVGREFPSYKQTIGAEFLTKQTPNKKTLQIWHTGGEEKFIRQSIPFLRGSDAFVFVVDATKPLSEISDHIGALLEAAKRDASDAKFYVVINKCDPTPHEDFKNKETAKNSLKQFVTGITKENLADDAVFFLAQDENVENINAVFNKIEKDYIREYEPHLLEQKSPKSLAKETSTLDQPKPFSTLSKVWIGGNLLLGAGALALIGLSVGIATAGIFPAVILGLGIALSVGVVAWNIGCKIYENYSKNQEFAKKWEGIDEPEPNHKSRKKPIEQKPPTTPELQSSSIYTPAESTKSSLRSTESKSENLPSPPSPRSTSSKE